jgi:hypothetical protein
VKLSLRRRLHAKLYLLFRHDPVSPIVGFLGSSNLSFAGLKAQGELNVEVLDHDACAKLAKWFHDRWEDRLCLDISDELVAIIDESWAREKPLSPHHVYVKMAYHLAREARAGLSEFRVPREFRNQLFELQTAAVKIAAHHLNKRGGVLIGDVVGLGKTLIATALAKLFEERVVDSINSLTLPRYGLGNYVALPSPQAATPAETKVLQGLSRAGQRLTGFCRTNLFKRLESSGTSFLLSLQRHVLRNHVFLHAIEKGLPVPLGAQGTELLDSCAQDEDADDTIEELYAGGVPAPVATTGLRTVAEFRARAAEVYAEYQGAVSTRWASNVLPERAFSKWKSSPSVAATSVTPPSWPRSSACSASLRPSERSAPRASATRRRSSTTCGSTCAKRPPELTAATAHSTSCTSCRCRRGRGRFSRSAETSEPGEPSVNEGARPTGSLRQSAVPA